MCIQEIELAVQQLSEEQLGQFTAWFEEFIASEVDRKLEAAINRGFFDEMAHAAREDAKAGRCTPL